MHYPAPHQYQDPELAEYDERVSHYKAEHKKLMGWRKNRLDKLRNEASVAAWERPTAIHDTDTILWVWSRDDPKLKEYNAGLEIVERRLAVYANLAANRRLQLQGELLLQLTQALQAQTNR